MLQFVFVASLIAAIVACGGSSSEQTAPERNPLQVKASAVDGRFLHFDDLASEDTVLWFWAPW